VLRVDDSSSNSILNGNQPYKATAKEPSDAYAKSQPLSNSMTVPGNKALYKVHATADVSPLATIGNGTRIWHHAQVREEAFIGQDCVVGKGVYIDHGVRIGDNCKIQNHALIYSGTTLEDGVFVGPGACIANDRHPRAITPDGTLRTEADWRQGTVIVKRGASLGSNSTLVPDVVIGEWAMVAAGAVVVGDVPDHGLVQGVPARLSGFVCRCGHRLTSKNDNGTTLEMQCVSCSAIVHIQKEWARRVWPTETGRGK